MKNSEGDWVYLFIAIMFSMMILDFVFPEASVLASVPALVFGYLNQPH